jgi:hypothetical protein
MMAAAVAQRAAKAQLRPSRVPAAALTRYAFSADTSLEPIAAPSEDPDETDQRPKASSSHRRFPRKRNHFRNHHKKKSWDRISSDDADVPKIGFTNILKSLSNQEMVSDVNDCAEEKKPELIRDVQKGNGKVSMYWKNHNKEKKHYEQNQSETDPSLKEDMAAIQDESEKQQNTNETSNNYHRTSSEWLLVTNTPPMSKLSDLLPSLSNILEFEINKGILDLDQLFTTNNPNYIKPEYYTTLKEMNTLDSLYTLEDLKLSNLPILDLSIHPEESLPSQLISETRFHLSYTARPMGWFLRFQNKSIAHAIRCHINEAERHASMISDQHKFDRMKVRKERVDWVEGLWKKVQADYNVKKIAMQNALVREDDVDERELMWGEDVVSRVEVGGNDTSFGDKLGGIDEAVNTAAAETTEDSECVEDVVNTLYEEYAQSHPYPDQSTAMSSVESVFGLYQLKCGPRVCKVNAFSPNNIPSQEWDQHSFHLGKLLELSDSVVRVDTRGLRTTVDNIKYLFRAFDFKGIYLGSSDEMEQLQSSFAGLPKSIGWRLSNYETVNPEMPKYAAVDLLIAGKERREFRPSNGKPTAPANHTFLIRFASPSDARMAVREMQGKMYENEQLLLTQYPSANII